MPKKERLSFAELGLTTPLPEILSKSREVRHREKVDAKKERKERSKAAVSQVAESRTLIEKHKQQIEEDAQKEKQEKAKRKREFQLDRLHAQREREEAQKLQDAARLASQKEITKKLIEEEMAEKRKLREIAAVIAKEREEHAKLETNVHVPIHRSEDIEKQRAGLPVLREEQAIVEAINGASRSCVLICGETGSGKTTQIPQFLWEAGYGHPEGAVYGREGCILVTEPRRVAAVSMARRVAEELNVTFGDEVCYHVRYDNNLSEKCKLKFATEGIILKEIQSDFLLQKYSVVIVDEAHERSMSCDILIGLLSRLAPLRNEMFRDELRACGGDVSKTKTKPIKLVIMSATMRVADFRDNRVLFPVLPQLLNVEARRFPVTNHFARKTELKEYVDEAFHKVRQIHKKLPPGGILVFLCTQQEIEDLCHRLRTHYSKTKIEYYEGSYSKHALLTGKSAEEAAPGSSESDDDVPANAAKTEEVVRDEHGLQDEDYNLDEDNLGGGSEDGGTKRSREDGVESGTQEVEDEVNGEYDTLHVLPLYALLDFQKQQLVFNPPPKGTRLCVVATNVAETSITIPNIKYVVDSGRVKTKVLDEETQASSYRIEWTSQASSEQRSGRAGRVGPGHCYRLFSTAVFANVMAKHSKPEILRSPLDSVVLLMKNIGIEQVGGFPFPSPPREADLKAALAHLAVIGALDKSFHITNVGRTLVNYPVPPRFARAIVEALGNGVSAKILDTALVIVSVCSTTTSVFNGEGNTLKATKGAADGSDYDPRREAVRSLLSPGSDLITYFRAFCAYEKEPRSACRTYCLVQKSMSECAMLYRQLRHLASQPSHSLLGQTDDLADSLDENESWVLGRRETVRDPLLSKDEEIALRELFIPGLLDQVARRATVHECRSFGVEYNDKRTTRTPYLITSSMTIAFVHPTSSIAKTYPPPEYLTFGVLQRVHRSETKATQNMMLCVTVVTAEWLRKYGYNELDSS